MKLHPHYPSRRDLLPNLRPTPAKAGPQPRPVSARNYHGPERRDWSSRDRLVARVAAEFREMPGQRLTVKQAARLFGLAADICARVLETLVSKGVLQRAPGARYTLRAGSPARD